MSPPHRHLTSYLESLPQGIDSYPDCVQKASVSREFLRFLPTTGLGALPAQVEALIKRPPPPSAWIPEAHVAALFLSVIDAHYPDPQQFVERAYVANKELLVGPLYRVLMLVASPLFLAKNAQARWGTFHRGVTMVTDSLPTEKTGTASFHLAYPPYLITQLLCASFGTAFRAAVEAAGGREVSTTVVRWQPEACHFELTWR